MKDEPQQHTGGAGFTLVVHGMVPAGSWERLQDALRRFADSVPADADGAVVGQVRSILHQDEILFQKVVLTEPTKADDPAPEFPTTGPVM